jgi:hypothetical protein
MVMQEHDLVFRQAQTYTTSFLFCLSADAPLGDPFFGPPKEDRHSIENDRKDTATTRLANFSQPLIGATSASEYVLWNGGGKQYPLKPIPV